MTLILILMRHAKSSWDAPGLPDHDRPLNPRGVRSAKALGNWLREQNLEPRQALVSTSRRTCETYEGLELPVRAGWHADLYHADARTMMNRLRQCSAAPVLMLGHNPGTADFASRIVTTPPAHDRFFDFPTCATLVARFPQSSWADIDWATAETLNFVIPRELLP